MKTNERLRICARLFCEMFGIALFVLGGGYAILAAAENRFARKLKWLPEGELAGMLPVFQMVPGILAGHTAVYVGRRLAGVPGAVSALIGTILPSVLAFTAVSVFYRSIPLGNPVLQAAFLGLRAAIAGLLGDLVVRSWRRSVPDLASYAILVLALVALVVCGVPAGWVIVGGLLTGLVGSCGSGGRVFRSFWAIPLFFLCYGLIAFGGGYVLVPVYLRDFVGAAAPFLQLPREDFANVMALTQMTPGPIGINCATFFGFRMAGVTGALVASICLVLPGSLILFAVLRSLERFRSNVAVRGLLAGVRPVTVALMLVATWTFLGAAVGRLGEGSSLSPVGCALVGLSFFAFRAGRFGAVPVILASALLSCAIALVRFVV